MKAEQEVHEKTVLGFWIYLLTDLMMFGTLFATYFVLLDKKAFTCLKSVFFQHSFLFQTLLFLTLSVVVGVASRCLYHHQKQRALLLLGCALALGGIFLGMQFLQFKQLMHQGYRWDSNGSFSAFYTIIWTHTLHVILGLLWTVLFMISFATHFSHETLLRRCVCLKLFWQFLNIIWILIWSFILLKGAVG
ncbi:MAG: hypothetical protein QRY72_02735 [Candidatus Rhabdochlamydia sp.]